MKKIILFLISYFLLGCISVSANRYGKHLIPYAAGGALTSCNQDGQGAAGVCAQIGGLPLEGGAGACLAGPSPAASAGNITYCLYWDQEIPTVGDNYGALDGVWTNGSRTITLSPVDTGGSGINTTKWCEGAACNPSTGTVGTSIVKSGDYNNTIRYQTWDVAGNASAIGSVIVRLDNSIPVVSATNSTATWKNADISITLSSSDSGGSTLAQSRYSWTNTLNAGCTAGGTSFVNGAIITDSTQGAKTLYLCSVDDAGNVDTWSGTYNLDKTDPNVSANNATATWKNAIIAITLSTSDTLSAINHARYSWTNTLDAGCTAGGAAFTNGTIITDSTQGARTLYLCSRDNAGNINTWSGLYNLDMTFPTLTGSNSTATWKNANISITLNTTDTLYSLWDEARYSWTNTLNASCTAGGTAFTNGTIITDSTEGARTLYLCSRDNAGNVTTSNGTYNLDKTNPNVSANNATATWKNADIPISLTASDTISLVNHSRYSWTNTLDASCTTGGASFTSPLNITGSTQGAQTLYLCSRDNAGNIDTWSGAYNLDKTFPTLSANNFDSARKNVGQNITLNTTDTFYSLWNQARFSWSPLNPTCTVGGTNFIDGFSFLDNTDGAKILNLCSRDNAGNVSTWTGSYKLDRVAPTLSVSSNFIVGGSVYNGTWTNKDVRLTLTCNDGGLSGCNPTDTEYRIETSSFACNNGLGTRTDYVAPLNFAPALGNKLVNYVCFRAKDNAGNGFTYTATATPIMIDKVNPTSYDTYPILKKGEWYDQSTYTFSLVPNDDDSGVKYVKWCEMANCDLSNESLGNSGTVITMNSIYNNTIKYRVWDNAGNGSTIYSFVLKLNGPIITEKAQDNDSDARSEIVGYITKPNVLENIFWSNSVSNAYIKKNVNNEDNAYLKAGEVTTGYINLSVDKKTEIRVVEFDRSKYIQNKELSVLNSYSGTVNAGSGYIQISGSNLNLTGAIGSASIFNLAYKDYAVFVKNTTGTGVLNYKITGKTATKGIYLNPINDYYPKEIKLLSSHIIISGGVYIGKQSEFIKRK